MLVTHFLFSTWVNVKILGFNDKDYRDYEFLLMMITVLTDLVMRL